MNSKEEILSAAITKAPVAAVVRIKGTEDELRFRVGTVEFVDADKGYATLKLSKGFRSVRLNDVILASRL